jgi:predicted alpha/beta hydrolase family esterase
MKPPLHHSPRLLVIPGLHDSGPAHWQTWLQSLYRDAVRVVQRDWQTPDLERWSGRIARTLEHAGAQPWVAVAHSFGCLALTHGLQQQPQLPIRAVLLVAPAEPDRFGLAGRLPQQPLRVPATVVTSDTDPWMTAASARRWAVRWGAHVVNLGDAGHINAEAGFGPLPLARRWVEAQRAHHARARRAAQADRQEGSFAV